LQAVGVVISQYLSSTATFEYKIANYDWINFLELQVMVTMTLVFITPTLIWFYAILGRAKLSIIASVVVDQFVFSPLFTFAIISFREYFLNHVPTNKIVEIVMPILPSALISGWSFWIPQRFIALAYFPPSLQLPFTTLCSLAWNVVFAMILK
jgi:hypothetical protein